MSREICDGCGNEIDPECCGCGEERDCHDSMWSGHPFVPMGCDCMRCSKDDSDCSPDCTAPTEGDCIRDGRSCLDECPACKGFGFDLDGTALRQVCRVCGGSGYASAKACES